MMVADPPSHVKASGTQGRNKGNARLITDERGDFRCWRILTPTRISGSRRLRTRLRQVLVRDGDDWKIVVYHNVDIKPGIESPELR
jgi:hypothetical protein